MLPLDDALYLQARIEDQEVYIAMTVLFVSDYSPRVAIVLSISSSSDSDIAYMDHRTHL